MHRADVTLDGAEGIVTRLPKIYEAFHADMDARTCPHCGAAHPGKGKPPEEWVTP